MIMKGFSKRRVTAWLLIAMLILSAFGGLSSPAAASEVVIKNQFDMKVNQSKTNSNVPFDLDSAVSGDNELQQITQQTAVGSFPQKLTDWVLDKETGMIYAISESTNKLYFINKQTLAITNELQLSGVPSDLYKYENKLYISQANNLIQSVDIATKSLDEQYPTTQAPLDVAVSATHIFFATDREYVYSIDRTTKAVKFYNFRMSYSIDIQVASDNRTLYLADRGSSRSNFYSFDIIEEKVISSANYEFNSPNEEIIVDEQSAYFAGYRMNKADLSQFWGEYQKVREDYWYYHTRILGVTSNHVLTTQGIYDKNTYLNLATLPFEPTQGILEEDGSVLLFKSETSTANNKIYRYSISVNQNPQVQMNKLANTLESNFTITDWVTTEDSPYIYAVLEKANALTVIRKSDFSTVKSVRIGSRPVDVEINNGKVYVALRGEASIAQFNIADTENSSMGIEKRLVKGFPIKIEPFNGKVFYSAYGVQDTIKVLTATNEHSVLPFSADYYDLDAEEEALYLIESMYHKKIDANTHSVLLNGNYHIAVSYDTVDLHKDGNFLYFDNRSLSATDLSTLIGEYPEHVLYAKDELVFGSRAVYDRDTFLKIIDLPTIISKAYVADDQSIIVSSGKKLIKYANLNDADKSNITPRYALFMDSDDREGLISGQLAIVPTENPNTIQSYNAYFVDGWGNKSIKLNMTLESQQNGVLYYRIVGLYSTPGVDKIGIYPVSAGGVEAVQYLKIEPWDAPAYLARNIRLDNANFTETGLSGTLTWDKGPQQPINAYHQIYFMDEDGLIGDPIQTVKANQYFYSVDIDNVNIPDGAIGLGITIIKSNGEEPPYYSGFLFEELISSAPLLENITITNNGSSDDTVAVSGLTSGDIIRVYNEAETILLGEGTVGAGQTSVTISISDIGSPGQKVSVTRETIDLYESAGTVVVIPTTEAPPVVTPPVDPPPVVTPPVDPPPVVTPPVDPPPVVTPPVDPPPIVTPPAVPVPVPPPSGQTPPPATSPKVHTITVTAGANGTISPSGSVKVVEGTNQTFTITPEKGYEIDKLQVDGVEVSVTDKGYTFTNIKSNHTISVTFKAEKDVIAPLAPEVNEVTDKVTTITGTAEAGAKVTAKVGTKVIGETVASTTGQFKMTIAKQIAGTTIVVTAMDVAKNVSEQTEVTVEDVTPPTAPKVNEVKDFNRKIAGKAEAGSTVTILVGSKVIGETTANSKGNFAVMISAQKAGTVLKVVATDLAENTSKSTSITVIDKTPPAKPTVSNVTSTSVKVTGKAEVGSTVVVKVGSQVIGTVIVGKDGKYSVGISKQKVNVVLTVSLKDKSGNESVAVKVTVKK
jgi:hypothetical protein